MSDAFVDTPLGSCIGFARGNVSGGARAAAFFGSFIPTLLAVFFLSTPRLRRQWAFWILAGALLIAMGKCILEMHMMISPSIYEADPSRLDTYDQWLLWFLADFIVQWTIPWICDCALLCKLLAFHPASSTSWKRRAAIMAFPLAMHVPRVPLLLSSAVLYILQTTVPLPTLESVHNRLLAAEGALQAAQNLYCSGFLLLKARQYARADYDTSSQQAQRVRLGLRYFTESILFTFLPASVLQAGWLVTALVYIWSTGASLPLRRADFYLRMFNVTFSINFGLLAVWWATARIHAQELGQVDSQLWTGTAKEHASALDMSLLDWALGPIGPEDNRVTRDEVSDVARSSPAKEQCSEKEEKTSLRSRRRGEEREVQ